MCSYFEYTPAAPANMLNASSAARSLLDYRSAGPWTFKQAAVVGIASDGARGEATLQGGERLAFDYALLATGSSYPAGVKAEAAAAGDRAARLQQFTAIREQVGSAAGAGWTAILLWLHRWHRDRAAKGPRAWACCSTLPADRGGPGGGGGGRRLGGGGGGVTGGGGLPGKEGGLPWAAGLGGLAAMPMPDPVACAPLPLPSSVAANTAVLCHGSGCPVPACLPARRSPSCAPAPCWSAWMPGRRRLRRSGWRSTAWRS